MSASVLRPSDRVLQLANVSALALRSASVLVGSLLVGGSLADASVSPIAVDPSAIDAALETGVRPAYWDEEAGTIQALAEGSLDRARLAGLGVSVETEAGGVFSLRIPRAALEAVLESPGLERIELAHRLQPMLNVSVSETGADLLWGGTPPNYTGLSGAGVVLGIVDTGIDLAHQDFKNSNGKTRLLNLWDQTAPTVNPPPGFSYGRQWTPTEIDRGDATQFDGNGHGTFLAGIAAGNGRGTGNGEPAFQYVGVAPEADLVVVKSDGTSTRLLDGVNYIFQRASAAGKPAVVVFAFGTHVGGHDGTDPLEQALNGLSGPGRIVCAAAGNYGDVATHGTATVSPSSPKTVSFRVPTTSGFGDQWVILHGWYNAGKNVTVSVRSPGGTLIGPVTRGNSLSQESGQGYVTILNGTTTNSAGDYRITVQTSKLTVGLAPGLWKIEMTAQTTSSVVDFWVTDYFGVGTGPTIEDGLTYDRTIVVPATADSVISVGAYTTKRSWVAKNGTTYSFSSAVMDQIATWSGRGPTRRGRVAPDVAAPGYCVGASLSASASVSPTRILPDLVHYIHFGTSAAAAHVAGAVALLLEEDRNLSVNAARLRLHGTARTDGFTGATPNSIWGYGKLFVPEGVTAVGDPRGLAFGLRAPFPNPTSEAVGFEFVLDDGDLQAASGGVRLRILDVRGRLVAEVAGDAVAGPQRLVWDGRALNGGLAPSGLYFGRLTVGARSAERKFIRLGR